MLQEKLDLKTWLKSPLMKSLSKQFRLYEQKARNSIKDLDLKGQQTRHAGQKQLKLFLGQLGKTRGQLEKTVTKALHKEGKLINKKVTELMQYLKTIANEESKKKAITAKVKARAKKARAKAKETISRVKTEATKISKAIKERAETPVPVSESETLFTTSEKQPEPQSISDEATESVAPDDSTITR